MTEKIRIVHYLNQFFAQIGGEDKAESGPGFRAGPIGPGRVLQQTLAEHGEILATLFCGDNYFAEHLEEGTEELLRHMIRFNPQLLIAGPAFESGRYGLACGALCVAAQKRLGIHTVTGMDEKNTGAALYRKSLPFKPLRPANSPLTGNVFRGGIRLAQQPLLTVPRPCDA